MKNIWRLTALLLALLFACGALAACSGDGEIPKDTQSSGEPTTSAYPDDNLPELDYRNEVIDILCWDAESNPEFGITVEEGKSLDQISDAVYTRNIHVEDRLNVSLSFTTIGLDKWDDRVRTMVSSGLYADLLGAKTQVASGLTANGYLIPLNTVQGSYVDLASPWWSQEVSEKTTVNGKYYFATGDISPNFVRMLYCVYFNNDLIREKELESPYDLVTDDQWTLSKMLEMANIIYEDLDAASDPTLIGPTDGDKLGLVGNYFDVPCLLHGCAVPLTEYDELGQLSISSSLKGDKAIGIIDRIGTEISKMGVINNLAGTTHFGSSFVDGRALFITFESGSAIKYFKGVTFEAGVVPCPKYDDGTKDSDGNYFTTQDRYYSTVRQPISMYCMMTTLPQERQQMGTAIMEALASEGYRTVTPVLFDSVMKLMNSTSAQMSSMLQLIRESAWTDFGRVFSGMIGAISDTPGYAMSGDFTWSSYLSSTMPSVEEKLAKFLLENFS